MLGNTHLSRSSHSRVVVGRQIIKQGIQAGVGVGLGVLWVLVMQPGQGAVRDEGSDS